MNFINKLILKRAESIKWKEEQRKAEETKRKDADNAARIESLESERLFKRKCIDDINVVLDKYIKEKEKEIESLGIKPGDEAILNIYDFGKRSKNGWDGGADSLSRYIPKENRIEGSKVKITEVYVDRSFTDELVDRFLSKHSYEELKRITYGGSLIWNRFYDFLAKRETTPYPVKRDKGDFDIFGLYWAAKFETNIEFKPVWGLNVNSFIVNGELGYKETIQLIKLEERSEKIRKQTEKIQHDISAKTRKIMNGVNLKAIKE